MVGKYNAPPPPMPFGMNEVGWEYAVTKSPVKIMVNIFFM
jgi:hypothetical protein